VKANDKPKVQTEDQELSLDELDKAAGGIGITITDKTAPPTPPPLPGGMGIENGIEIT
jgi:hypothetical protein